MCITIFINSSPLDKVCAHSREMSKSSKFKSKRKKMFEIEIQMYKLKENQFLKKMIFDKPLNTLNATELVLHINMIILKA